MEIKNLFPGGYAANSYLVIEGNTAVLIDCSAPAASVLAALRERGLTLTAILLTHGHFDHVLTLADVKAATNAPVYLAEGDADLPADGEKNAFAVFFGYDKSYPNADVLFAPDAELTFGELKFRTIHTPGHTNGSTVYLTGNVAFTGDTIFAAGYGRYDLYGGNSNLLTASLAKISALPKETVIYPGHGERTTLGAALAAIQMDLEV